MIFCCVANFSQARIFFACSLGSIFSGAVAFISADVCADTVVARKSMLKATIGKHVVRPRMAGLLEPKLVWNDRSLKTAYAIVHPGLFPISEVQR